MSGSSIKDAVIAALRAGSDRLWDLTAEAEDFGEEALAEDIAALAEKLGAMAKETQAKPLDFGAKTPRKPKRGRKK